MAIIEFLPLQEDGKKRFSVKNPATLELLYELDCESQEGVDQAVQKAHDAQRSWKELSVKQRVKYFHALRDVILDRQQDIIDTVIQETGKTEQDALTLEVYAVCSFITYWCQQAIKNLKDEVVRAPGVMGFTKKIHTSYKPLGVVGIISPWNGPFVLSANPAIQAMLAGNSVVIKGSEITPISTKIFEKLCLEAGIPEGVCTVLIGDGETGAALTQSDIQKVVFTGSAPTGKKVAVACAQNLIPFSLELGGNDAMIVCRDANLDDAVHGAVWGGCVNSGHYCCGVERIYVEAAVYDEFVARLTQFVDLLNQGREHGEHQDVGAIFWDKQLEIITSHVEQAKRLGAKTLTGGQCMNSNKGLYYPVTVMEHLDEKCDLMTRETFGPILPIVKVDSAEQAIEKANDSDYGLHGSIWTQDLDKGRRLARQVDTGAMSVNDVGIMYGLANVAFGGVKSSGLGSVNGAMALRSYTHPMPVVVGKYSGREVGYPHTPKKLDNMRKLMHFLWKNPIGKRFFG